MKKLVCLLSLVIATASFSWALPGKTGNNPAFLWIDMVSNGYGEVDDAGARIPFLNPDTFDIGVDVGADGTVDTWLSEEHLEYFYRDNREFEDFTPFQWRRFFIRLDSIAGDDVQAKLIIKDLDPNYYMAINTIRLNNADGTVVPNMVPNGDFEADTLEGWSITDGSITDPSQVLVEDPSRLVYDSKFLTTYVDGNEDTVVLESDTFNLKPLSSFIYFLESGGASELWNNTDVTLGIPEEPTYIYLDVGTESEDPNGQYDEGTDVPVLGVIAGTITDRNNDVYPYLMNTSGLEGRRAQFVAVDNSFDFFIGLDAVRMNYSPDIITNGDFEQELPEEVVGGEDIPTGASIPGWTMSAFEDGDGAEAVLYNPSNMDNTMKSHAAMIGTGEAFIGTEIRSDVFTIEEIPTKEDSVYLTFFSAQSLTEVGPDARAAMEIQVDSNNDGTFEDILPLTHAGLGGWNAQNSAMDHVHTPRFRIYIDEEYQGSTARIFVEDGRTGGWDWSVYDDFYFWNGSEVVTPIENMDFELGPDDNLEPPNWTVENRDPAELRTVLAGSQELWLEGTALHRPLNNRTIPRMEGDWTLDTADHSSDGGPGGDGGDVVVISDSFTLPSNSDTNVKTWSLY